MSTPTPTNRELEILQVLWRRKEASVREIYEDLRDELPIVQTTVQAFLRTMTTKGLVAYREKGRSYVYHALVEPEPTRRRLLNRVLQGVYDGAVDRLVEGAVRLQPPSDDELAKLRLLLAQLEGEAEQRRREES
ncbi:MAG: BlaI/MecI/CopY family transcriptional regulator [Planctomycetes bacterium]|nr:BlaI/MecI/CopY family transcriptional regulator [Planctomycetota bacterium]